MLFSLVPVALALAAVAKPLERRQAVADNGSCQSFQDLCTYQIDSAVSNPFALSSCVLGAACNGNADSFLAIVYARKGGRGTPPKSRNVPRISNLAFSEVSPNGATVSQQNFIDAYYSRLNEAGGPYPNVNYVIPIFLRIQGWTNFCGRSIPKGNFLDYFQYAATVNGPGPCGGVVAVPTTTTASTGTSTGTSSSTTLTATSSTSTLSVTSTGTSTATSPSSSGTTSSSSSGTSTATSVSSTGTVTSSSTSATSTATSTSTTSTATSTSTTSVATTVTVTSSSTTASASPSGTPVTPDASCNALFNLCAAQVDSTVSNPFAVQPCVLAASCFGGQRTIDNFLRTLYSRKGQTGTAPSSRNVPRVSDNVFYSISTGHSSVSSQNFVDAYYRTLDQSGGPYPSSANVVFGYFKGLQGWTGYCGRNIPRGNFLDYFQYSATVSASGPCA